MVFTLALGGEQGIVIEVKAGDVLVIPAGGGHCNQGADGAFRVVGAHPDGMNWDMGYGNAEERPEKLDNIKKGPLPEAAPGQWQEGPVREHWR